MAVKVTPQERNRQLERENLQLRAELEQARADLDFVAIMTDVDIDTEGGEDA